MSARFRVLGHPRGACGLVAVILACAAVVLAARPAADMDAWWIAATGRTLAETGYLPRTNLYSFTEPSHPWVMHEALFAVVFHRGLSLAGPAFLSIFAFLSACATTTVVIATGLARARHLPSAAAFSALVLFGVFTNLDSPRPLYASVFFAALVAALAFADRFPWQALVAAVVCELVWANAHGSFPLGVLLLAAGAIAKSEGRPRRIAAVALAALATLANPHGPRVYALVARYAADTDAGGALIRARLGGFMPLWRAPPFFVDTATWIGLVTVVVAAVAALRTGRYRWEALVALAMVALGALHVRHLVLGVVVGAVVLAPSVDDRFAAPGSPPAPLPARLRRVVMVMVPPLAAGSLALLVALAQRPRDAWIAPLLGGEPFVHLAAGLPPDARVYTHFHTAGLVLWLASPRGVRVLYDSRNDCYSPELISAAFTLDDGALPGSALRAIVERYGTDHALLLTENPIAQALAASSAWETSKSEGGWTLFARRGP